MSMRPAAATRALLSQGKGKGSGSTVRSTLVQNLHFYGGVLVSHSQGPNVALSRWAHATTIMEDFVTTLDGMFWGRLYPTLAELSWMRADAVSAW